MAIVRALDVGYGNTKFVVKHETLSSKVHCEKFPSKTANPSSTDLGAGFTKNGETVVVEVGDNKFEVGPAVETKLGTHDVSSVLDEHYVGTDAYMALTLGAMNYMAKEMGDDQDQIDMLVVGLPVSTYESKKDALTEKMIGTHSIAGNRLIHIKSVKVFPQPLGAFFNFMFSEEEADRLSIEDMSGQTNLVIDPGHFSFDWLLAKGMTPIAPRSGATYRGMSAYIKAVADDIVKATGALHSLVLSGLESSFRDGKQYRLRGTPYDIEPHKAKAQSVITGAVNELANSVGDGTDIDNILLVGGGAEIYREAIEAKFPHNRILVSKEPVFANVVGFQLAGERSLLRDQVRERKASAQS